MKLIPTIAVAAAAALTPAAAQAQMPVVAPAIAGTRLEVNATGEVNRVPDLALISAGVVTRAATATGAIEQNAARMERVRAALRKAGIADRDIQTSSINLNPEYSHVRGQAPRLTGYTASNMVNVRFRDIRSTGAVLDALVAEGANQISGPTLSIDKPEPALDEARAKALAAGKARAEMYARSLGMRVVRLLSVSEGGGYGGPRPMMRMAVAEAAQVVDASSSIEPGEQRLQVSVAMSFELQ